MSKYHVNNTATRTVCGLPYTIVGRLAVAPYTFKLLAPEAQCKKCRKLTPVAAVNGTGEQK